MDKTSEAILALKPSDFPLQARAYPEGIPQFGLVAAHVEKLNPDLVVRNDKGKAYTVRYEAVNAMLLNEFLKEHRRVEEQDRKGQEQAATIAEMKKQIAVLTTSLQKVGDELQMSKAAPQMVTSD